MARAVQGVGGAIVTPLTLTIMSAAMPRERRGLALGTQGGVSGLGVAIGPLVGGAVVQGLSWQWIFWLNVPIGLILLPLAITRLTETTGPRRSLDLPGLGLASAGLFGIVFGLVRASEHGWTSLGVIGWLIAGGALLAGFAVRELLAPAPMVPMRFFRDWPFSGANLTSLFLFFGLFGSVFLLTQFFQIVQGYTPLPSTPKRTCSITVIVGSSASRRPGYPRANHDHLWMVYAHNPMILAQSSSDADEALGEAFHDLRLRDTHYCRAELSAPWGLQMEPCDIVTFHFVAEGRCWLSGAGGDRWLERGDLVVFARGQGHLLADRPGSPARPVRQLPKLELGRHSSVLEHGGDGTRALLLCGGSQFDPPDQPLVRLLPQVMVLTNGNTTGDGQREDWVGTILSVMGAEAAAPRAGGETIVTRLSDVVLIHAIRAWLATSSQAREGWLGALRDRHLGRAIAAMHRDPGHPWTVASLAASAHLSRSAFAQRFTLAVGLPPSAYLTQIRMRLATAWMRDHGLTPSQVAPRVGYDSLAAFTRAYKRSTGRTPGSVRQPT